MLSGFFAKFISPSKRKRERLDDTSSANSYNSSSGSSSSSSSTSSSSASASASSAASVRGGGSKRARLQAGATVPVPAAPSAPAAGVRMAPGSAASAASVRVAPGSAASAAGVRMAPSSAAAAAATTLSVYRPRYNELAEPNIKWHAVAGESEYAHAQFVAESELAVIRAAAPAPAAWAARLREARSRKLQAVSRHLNGDDVQCLQLLSGSLELGTPGEYTTGSLLKLMAFVAAEHPPGPTGVFCDVGSGLGRPVFAAVLSGVFEQAVGVEIVLQQVTAARATAARFGVPRVEFLHLDAAEAAVPFDATHLYIFSQGFDGELLRGVAAQLNRQRTWRVLLTATPPERWAAAGLRFSSARPPRVLTGMKMVGSGRAYCLYVLLRR